MTTPNTVPQGTSPRCPNSPVAAGHSRRPGGRRGAATGRRTSRRVPARPVLERLGTDTLGVSSADPYRRPSASAVGVPRPRADPGRFYGIVGTGPVSRTASGVARAAGDQKTDGPDTANNELFYTSFSERVFASDARRRRYSHVPPSTPGRTDGRSADQNEIARGRSRRARPGRGIRSFPRARPPRAPNHGVGPAGHHASVGPAFGTSNGPPSAPVLRALPGGLKL